MPKTKTTDMDWANDLGFVFFFLIWYWGVGKVMLTDIVLSDAVEISRLVSGAALSPE